MPQPHTAVGQDRLNLVPHHLGLRAYSLGDATVSCQWHLTGYEQPAPGLVDQQPMLIGAAGGGNAGWMNSFYGCSFLSS